MTGYKRVNYYELCRLCTSSQSKDKIHIFREEGRKMQLQQKIQSCFPLLVCEHDYLPKVVCTTCIEALDHCYTFRQNCVNSETMLSSYFSNFRFTDDFKKAGKVYVKDKDTGQQKLETLIQNNANQMKKIQENLIPNNTNTTTILQDGNQQYFNLELPTIHKISSYSKLVPNPNQINIQNQKIQNTDFLALNSNQLINTKVTDEQIKYNLSQNCQNNVQSVQLPTCNTNLTQLSSNLTTLTSNFNNTQNILMTKQPFDQKINNLEPNNSEILKSNLIQSHALMYIDIEQLVESGLPEHEINKLKEVLLKPIEYNNQKTNKPNVNVQDEHHNLELSKLTVAPAPIIPSLTVNVVNEMSVLNNINNNQIKSEAQANDKNFKCEICDKVFKRREHLYQHTKLHSGLRPFNCIHCPKTFSRKEHLIRHLTSHSGVKDFSCDVCNKKFSRPDNLKKHKKTHQKSGPFICEVCAKSFVIKHYYLAHKLQHHDDGNIMLNKIEGNDI